MRTRNSKSLLLALLLPVLLLSACATPSSVSTPVQPPQIPALPPSLARPVPQESFLDRAQRNIEAWRKTLMDSETK